MNADDKIRAILHAEADTVDPSPAGWDAIQRGVAARRGRVWWTRGTALAGAAAVFVGVTTFVAFDRSRHGVEQGPTTGLPTTSAGPATPSGEPAPTEPGLAPRPRPAREAIMPIEAVWPLTTTAEVAGWRADPTSMPALRTSRGAAAAFAREYLQVAGAVVKGDEAFGVSELTITTAGGHVVSVVTVRGFGPDGTAPFSVTRAEARSSTLRSPSSGQFVRAPLLVSGTFEADDDTKVDVSVAADAGGVDVTWVKDAAAELGRGEFSVTLTGLDVPYTGSVLVKVRSASKPDDPGTMAAVPVTFARPGGPEAVVAERAGRIAVVATATGDVRRWLAGEENGARAYDPELSDDAKSVLYVQETGDCASEIRSVPTAGGAPTTVLGGEPTVSHPSRQGDVLAYLRTLCQDGGNMRQLVVRVRGEVVLETDGPLSGTGPVVHNGVVAWSTDGPSVRTFDTRTRRTTSHDALPPGCVWGPVAWRGDQLVGAALCHWAGGAPETGIHTVEREPRLLWVLPMDGVRWLDFAGEAVVVGFVRPDTGEPTEAWTIVDDYVTRLYAGHGRPNWG